MEADFWGQGAYAYAISDDLQLTLYQSKCTRIHTLSLPVPSPTSLNSVQQTNGVSLPSRHASPEEHLVRETCLCQVYFEWVGHDVWSFSSLCRFPLLSAFLLPRTIGDLTTTANSSFDRFGFLFKLSDYLPQSRSTGIPLLRKSLFLAIKYAVPGKGEWWDNCNGSNWRIGFKLEEPAPTSPSEDTSSSTRERNISAPVVVSNCQSSSFFLT